MPLETGGAGEGRSRLSEEDNELITRVGPGTVMGAFMREYWLPAIQSVELAGPDCDPLRVRLLGEDLIAFPRHQRPRWRAGQGPRGLEQVGLTLAEAKALLLEAQRRIVTQQVAVFLATRTPARAAGDPVASRITRPSPLGAQADPLRRDRG